MRRIVRMGNCACLPGNKHRSTALGPVPKAVSQLFEALSQGKVALSEKDVRAYLRSQVRSKLITAHNFLCLLICFFNKHFQ